jgi:hypothetical protein
MTGISEISESKRLNKSEFGYNIYAPHMIAGWVWEVNSNYNRWNDLKIE